VLQYPAQPQQILDWHLGPSVAAANEPFRARRRPAAAHAANLGTDARGGGLKAKTVRGVTSTAL
jgi:hypothetical protein